MYVYIQYHSPTRGSQKPILFDRADTPEEAIKLIAKAKKDFIENTTAFVGVQCNRCKAVFPANTLRMGFCAGCECDMADEDKYEPDGGAYREHQWT